MVILNVSADLGWRYKYEYNCPNILSDKKKKTLNSKKPYSVKKHFVSNHAVVEGLGKYITIELIYLLWTPIWAPRVVYD